MELTDHIRDQLLISMAKQVNYLASKEGYWNMTTVGNSWSTIAGLPGTEHKSWLNQLTPPKENTND